MSSKKLTLYIDEKIIKESKKIAIDKDTSVSKMVTNFLIQLIDEHNESIKKE